MSSPARSNTGALFNRLHAAAYRLIAANSLTIVSKDGKERLTLESLRSHHAFVDVLKELGDLKASQPIEHEKTCACRNFGHECDCAISKRIAKILEGA